MRQPGPRHGNRYHRKWRLRRSIGRAGDVGGIRRLERIRCIGLRLAWFRWRNNRYDRVVGGAMLGEDQWTWLEGELKKPARLRIIESGSAVFTAPVTPESWSGHLAERQRLINVVGDTMATGVITVSGDKHYSDVSRAPGVTKYPLYDFVSSSYNQGGGVGTGVGGPANANRDTPSSGIQECSFATIAIDWSGASPAVIEYRSAWNGDVLMTKKLKLADLGEV